MQKKRTLTLLLSKILSLTLSLLSKIIFWDKGQRIWLIACGGERWGDNADAFWRYMNQNHPEIKTIAVVKHSNILDIEEKYWVKRNKISSYILLLRAEVMATTHTLSDIGPDSIIALSKAKKVWLQHGVTGIGKITAEKARSGAYDMICVNSGKEKDIMEKELGVASDRLYITGFSRHDVLKEKVKKEFDRDGTLYIPTSRAWIDQTMKKEYETMLFSWLEKLYYSEMDIQFKIWLHPGWYKKGLNDLDSKYDNVQLYQLNTDPQQLILESKLLITDYSSVFFDAALSGIPTIFYQPDRVSYINNKGLFSDFLNEKTLLVVENENELITQLEEIINNKEYYQYRLVEDQKWAYKYVETFDGNSCQRIFARINEMIEQRKNHKKVY